MISLSDQQRYDLRRALAVALFVVQALVTAAIGQYRQDLGLTPFAVAVLSLVNVGIGAGLLASPRAQGDGMPRAS